MIIDGRALATKRKEELLKERAEFGPLTLGLVVGVQDTVTQSYLKIKKRVAAELGIDVVEYPTVHDASIADGIIVQLPLPAGSNLDTARNAIPAHLDVDILSDAAYAKFVAGEYPPPPVPSAMKYILGTSSITVSGKKVVIVGRGRLVGLPAAEMFRQMGGEVTMLGRDGNVPEAVRNADIVVLGTGVSGLLKSDMIKEGAVILDGGTSEMGGSLAGDADPGCAEKASLFTPVPGGIGPIAVAEIFGNLFALKRLS